MTKSMNNYTVNTGTLAAYLNYYGVISSTIRDVLPKTSDSGQVNWETITTEPTSPTVRDYEVFGFDDDLQDTAPIYLRFEYVGGGSTTNNRLSAMVGTTTNGSGTIGGVTVANQTLHGGFNSSANQPRQVYACSGDGFFVLFYNIDQSTTSAVPVPALVVERMRDPDGTPNGSGYMAYFWNQSAGVGGSTNFTGVFSRTFDGAPQSNALFDPFVPIPSLHSASSFVRGSTAYAFPAYGFNPLPQGASKALMMGFATDFPRTAPVTISHYGENMTFIPMGTQVSNMNLAYMSNSTTSSTRSNFGMLFRWE